MKPNNLTSEVFIITGDTVEQAFQDFGEFAKNRIKQQGSFITASHHILQHINGSVTLSVIMWFVSQ